MKIAGWHVDGFGHLRDLETHGLSGGLIVLTGPNEAGKSTLLDFLTGMLFGFPSGSTKLTKRPPLHGGDHGGRLWLADDDDTWLVARTPRTLVVRRGSDDATLGEADYLELLGGATRGLYRSVFAVDLDDLTTGAGLDDDELNDLVFSAGVVGAGRSATAAIASIDAQRLALYRPKGRSDNYRVLALRDALRVAEEELGAVRRAAVGAVAVRRSLAAAEAEAARLREELAALGRRDHELGVLTELWPAWVDGRDAEAKLAALPPAPLVPAEAVVRLDAAEALAAEEERRAVVAAAAVDEARAAQDSIVVDAEALAVASLVEELRGRQALVEHDRGELVRRREEEAVAGRELDRILLELGPSFDRSRLADPEHDLVTADALAAQGEAVQQARAAEARATDHLADVEQARLEQRARLSARRHELLAEGPTDRTVADERILGLERLRELVTAPPVPAAPTIAPWSPVPRPSAAALGAWLGPTVVLGLVVGLRAGLVAGVGVAVVALLVGAIVLLLRASRPPLALGARATEARPAGDGAVVPEAERLAVVLGVERMDVHSIGVALVVARVDREERAERAIALAALQREDAESAAAADARLRDARQRQQDAAAAVEAALAEWRRWLQERGLPNLTPVGAARFTELVRSAAQRFDEGRRATTAAEALAVALDGFEADVAAVAARLGVEAGPSADATLAMVVERVEDARSGRQAQREATQDAEAKAQVHALAVERAERAAAAVAALLADHAVGSGAELRAAAEATAQREALQARIDAAAGAVLLAAGEAGAPALRAALAEGDPSRWAGERDAVTADRVAAEERRDHVVDEGGDLRRRLAALEASGGIAEAELEVAGLRGELRAALRRWTVLGLARGLVAETLARYQRERQPRVLARAEELFSLVTDGRYPRLRTEPRVVIAIGRTGREVPATALSRGTREQLYLCLRFALAESFSERASLPIMLDDVLVNFDDERDVRVAAVIAEVARHRQVFAFACKDATRDLLLAADPTATVIALDRTTGALVPSRPAAGDIGRRRQEGEAASA